MRRLLIGLALAVLIIAVGNRLGQEPLPSTVSSQVETQSVINPVVLNERQRPVQPRLLRLDGMRAPVIPLTLRGSELVPPDDPKVLGWWGKRAGSAHGTTLLVGHTVHDGGGTFDNLEDVPVGSVAVVSGVRYRVERVHTIRKATLAAHSPWLFRQRGPHKLVLVTCEGYDPATGHYSSNVVVVARPEAITTK
jgi:hypothetical protein